MTLLEDLRWREMVYDTTEGLESALATAPLTAYVGFDPTASSLHVGSLLPIMALARWQRAGHVPIALVGGGTGLIGDPSGKSQERVLLGIDQVEANAEGIREQLARFLDFAPGRAQARLENNVEWLQPIGCLDFLRDVGKHFSVSAMLAKESVKRRLGSEEGLSFTEFTYQVLQAYDYLVLHQRFGCSVQMGGSDQWGNITAGCELVRKVHGARVHGLVLPLVTTSGGTKFGKTEAGTVWLDGQRTSPFRFYQFWFNADDGDALRYLKYFTWLVPDAIDKLASEAAHSPETRMLQRALAREVTSLVHGAAALESAERASRVLFGGPVADATLDDLLALRDDAPVTMLSAADAAAGIGVTDLAVSTQLAKSKGEAARVVRQGGLYLNDRRLTDERAHLTREDAHLGRVFVMRRGPRELRLVLIEG